MKINILIVDDDESIRESMQEFLEMEGFKVLSVPNAEKAIDFLKKNLVDIVLTDIIMFEMDGLELTNLIKKEYDTDVVVMTGYTAEHSYEQAISKGASDFLFKPFRFEELTLRLKRVLKERQLSSERSEMLHELKKLAITDGLTGLFNSRHFYKQLDIEVDRIKRYEHSISILIIDIDHFKDFNDSFGHMEGDKILIKLGMLIKSCLRRMDTAYRYGGEEFTVILPETNNADALIVAERIRKTIAEEIFIPSSGEKSTMTVSIGTTEYKSEERISTFVQRADKALYVSKELGRNRISSLPD
jgi:two-component system cell cycle response regulator